MKRSVVILFAAVALFSLAQVAGADTVQTVGLPNGYGPYQAGSGGEFTLVPTGNLLADVSLYASTTKNQVAGSTNFQSFCLETQETINAGQVYNAALNSNAVHGGVGAAGDPISLGTAYLYQQFALGTLSGYDYGSGRLTSAADLQNAIWYLEGEGGSLSTNYSNLLIAKFGTVTTAEADNAGTYGVSALNLTTAAGGLAQDQLILVPGTGTSVPEPGSMLLLGFGLVGLVGFRRKFKK